MSCTLQSSATNVKTKRRTHQDEALDEAIGEPGNGLKHSKEEAIARWQWQDGNGKMAIARWQWQDGNVNGNVNGKMAMAR